VHVRITSPPVQFPCFYGIDMANQEDLVAWRNTVEEIRELIGATSLGYLSLAGLTRAIGVNKENFCRACFDGKYPIEIPQHVKISKFALEMPVAAVDASQADAPSLRVDGSQADAPSLRVDGSQADAPSLRVDRNGSSNNSALVLPSA
jgi:amidophosphoribosyltransferase